MTSENEYSARRIETWLQQPSSLPTGDGFFSPEIYARLIIAGHPWTMESLAAAIAQRDDGVRESVEDDRDELRKELMKWLGTMYLSTIRGTMATQMALVKSTEKLLEEGESKQASMDVWITERCVEADFYSREMRGVFSTKELAKACVENDADILDFGPWRDYGDVLQRQASGGRFMDIARHFVFGSDRGETEGG